MPKSLKAKVGNKAKSRQHSKSIASGKYKRQAIITEVNRKRKRAKHLKMVEKKAARRLLFSL